MVAEAERLGVIYDMKKLDIYVTSTWSQLPIDVKQNLDAAVQCVLMQGKSGRIVGVRYKDAQTGKVVATSDYKLRIE